MLDVLNSVFDFWYRQKVNYLRRHDCLNFDAMRNMGVPSRIIKRVLLEELCDEVRYEVDFV